MSDKRKVPDFPVLVEDLRRAREDYDAKTAAERDADRALSAAKERLNQAQIALNNAMAQLKADAPWDTTWHNDTSRLRGETVA